MYSTVSKASFITALYIVFVPLLELLFKRKAGGRIWFPVLLAVAGLYFLCMGSYGGLQIGDAFLLIGSLLFAFQIIAIDRYSRNCDALVLTFVSQVTVGVLAFGVMLMVEGADFSSLSLSVLPVLYMVFIGGLLSQCIQICFQRDLESSVSSLLMSFESVFGALFGWLLLHQVMSVREIFGCVLVFLAILLAELR